MEEGNSLAPPEKEKPQEGDSGCDRNAPRFPRWTRQEILVLIEAKRVEECKGRRSRAAAAAGADGNGGAGGGAESKWAAISSYCKRRGVSREPVQCRKRWTTLWRDYKRIREWEAHHGERSFWLLRNDVKREAKLPAFFDRELYDVLERSIVGGRQGFRASAASPEPAAVAVGILESGGRSAVEEGMMEEFEPREEEEEGEGEEEEVAGTPTEKEVLDSPSGTRSGVKSDKLPTSNGEKVSTSSGAGQKRMHASEVDEDRDLKQQLLSILERNGQVLTAHVNSHNLNCQLDRDQRNEHTKSLVEVLGKLADALGRIADKLQ
uniref:Myb-like domain-containing protein n=1 Tax=Araucaria cunninghamii TaxID=56994 RepID=A0A0D6R3Y1_ARACU